VYDVVELFINVGGGLLFEVDGRGCFSKELLFECRGEILVSRC
jgi:hypothetical protein